MKNNTSVSVIIPTYKEGDYVGYLLYSLSRQTYRDFEVIISDGYSEDDTLDVAGQYNKLLPSLKIVRSKKRSPSVQRNAGVGKARFERLLFLDADTILPPNFLEKSIKELNSRKLDVGHAVVFPMSKKLFDQYLQTVLNFGLVALERIYPIGGGFIVFTTKKVHEKLNGFDERMSIIAEDVDYFARVAKEGYKFGILRKSQAFISMRRLDYEGRGKTLQNFVLYGLYMALFGKHNAQKLVRRRYGDFKKLLLRT